MTFWKPSREEASRGISLQQADFKMHSRVSRGCEDEGWQTCHLHAGLKHTRARLSDVAASPTVLTSDAHALIGTVGVSLRGLGICV